MKSLIIFSTLICTLLSARADEQCNHPILINKDLFHLYKTEMSEIEAKYGFTERFTHGDSRFKAICYQQKGVYLTFEFDWIENTNKLSNAAISALPPSGYEGSFCKSLDGKFNLSIDGRAIGDENKKHTDMIIKNTEIGTTLGSRGDFECSLFENSTHVNGQLIHHLKGLTETN